MKPIDGVTPLIFAIIVNYRVNVKI